MSRIRSSFQIGFRTGLINLGIVLLGLTGLAGTIVKDWFHLPSQVPGAWVLLLAVGMWGGARAVRDWQAMDWRASLAGGLYSGLPHALPQDTGATHFRAPLAP